MELKLFLLPNILVTYTLDIIHNYLITTVGSSFPSFSEPIIHLRTDMENMIFYQQFNVEFSLTFKTLQEPISTLRICTQNASSRAHTVDWIRSPTEYVINNCYQGQEILI